MLLTEFLDRLGKLDVLNYIGLDDTADRLNCLFTVLLLIVFSAVTTVKTYFLTPIACYLPTSVGSHEGQASYVTNMCYTDGLYNVPLEQFAVDNSGQEQWEARYSDRKIYYYQWLPFLFAAQGVAFLVPSLFWRLYGLAGAACDLGQLARTAAEAQKAADGDRREKVMRQVTRQLELWLRACRGHAGVREGRCVGLRLQRSLTICIPSKSRGTQLVWLYLATKLMYIGNLIGQLMLMAALVRTDPSVSLVRSAGAFSADLATQLASGGDWRRSGLFPRSGCCAVALRAASGVQTSVAQCALPVNMIHEKLFAFLWIWMPAVLLATVASFAVWCGRLTPTCSRRRHLIHSLRLAGAVPDGPEERALLDGPFADDFLGHDGDLLLRLMAFACGELAAAELCAGLFRAFAEAAGRKDAAAAAAVAIELGDASDHPPAATTARRRNHSGSGGFGHQHHSQHHHYHHSQREHHQDQLQQAPPPSGKLLKILEPEGAVLIKAKMEGSSYL